MKNYSLLIKLVVCALVAGCAFGLSQSPSYGQGRSLTKKQIDAIVTPTLAQCSPQSGLTNTGRIDPASIIPTANAREFPTERIARTLHGMWRGQVFGDYHRDLKVDYFWIIDATRNEGLIIAQRNGNESTGGLRPVANAPKISYLMCAHEGYTPSSEGGAQLHEFVKVSDSIADAPRILQKATKVRFSQPQLTLSDLWQEIVASGYFRSLPAVAFAGALFKPIRIELVPSAIGPSQVSLSWNSEYYGGGATQLKFTTGVPMRGVEYTQFIGTTGTSGDFLVASPGNGNLSKVEAATEYATNEDGDCIEESCYPEYYDLAFDSVTMGPLQVGNLGSTPERLRSQRARANHRTGNRTLNQHKRK